MDWNSIYPAPTKLNLFLHVVGRRADGYHLLKMLFRLIDHGDCLRFSPRQSGTYWQGLLLLMFSFSRYILTICIKRR